MCLLLLTSCGDGATANGMVIRDSAGVAIVRSAAPAWGEAEGWRVEAEPALEVGAEEGEEAYLLSGVTGAVRLGDGRIVVADRGSRQLRIFDRAGRHLLSVGREGSGPGEFGSVDRLELAPGDTLLAYDGMQNRLTVVAQDGQVAQVMATPTAPGGTPLWYAGRFEDGSLLLQRPAMLTPDARPGLRRDTVAYFRSERAAERIDSVGVLPGAESFVVAQGAGTAGYRRALTVDPVALVSGDSLFFATGEGADIEVRGADGGLRRRIHATLPVRAVTVEDRTRFRDGLLERTRGPAQTRLTAVLDAMPFPTTLPALERLLVDDEGNLWASEYRRPGETGGERWNVIDRSGRWLGIVEIPEHFRVMHAGRDFVLGVARDDLGVERVRLHHLAR